MKRRELKPGDIVRVCGYDRIGAYFQEVRLEVIQQIGFQVTLDSGNPVQPFIVHRNQCTPIRIVKKKRREWWFDKSQTSIETKHVPGGGHYHRITAIVMSTPPENPEGWVYLRECKWPKGEK